MREPRDAFHLAIPSRDLAESEAFYVAGLGCHLARRYDDRVTIDFFGDQIVCHRSESWDHELPDLYPRHFGVTFRKAEDFDAVVALATARRLPFVSPVTERFAERVERHRTVVLHDPSNNLLEFKHYHDPRMMY